MNLQVSVADLSQCRKDLTIEIAADEVRAEYDKAYEAYTRHAKIPGFRPGRVPRGVIKQRFAKEIREHVVGNLLPHALEHAIKDHKLAIISEPQIDEISVSEGEPLKFTASVETLPEFELKGYKGLKMTKRVARVTDEDIERVLERFRESAAEFVPVEDRPSQDGDFVSANIVGKYVEPQEEEDLKTDDVQIEIGSKSTLQEFSENLRGVKADDVREFRMQYPENFGSQGLGGKTLDFTATVVAVRLKELPELDDDFAQGFGEYENLQEMRDKIRENLGATANLQADNRLREEILDRLLNPYDFDLPRTMIENRAAERVQEVAYMLMQNGVSPQTIRGIDWAAQMDEARPQAVRDLRAAFILAKIAAAEGVEVAEEEVEEEIARLAAMQREPAEQLKARLTKDKSLSSIENTLRYQKALDAVINHTEIAVEEFTENQETEQARPEAAPESQSASKSAEQGQA